MQCLGVHVAQGEREGVRIDKKYSIAYPAGSGLYEIYTSVVNNDDCDVRGFISAMFSNCDCHGNISMEEWHS